MAWLATPAGIVGLYLVLSTPFAVAALLRGGTVGGAVALAAHLGFAFLFTRVARRPESALLGMMGALAAVPLLYAEVPWLHQAFNIGYLDDLVVSWEVALLGFEPARELASRLPSRTLSELGHLAYLSFYPGVYLPPLFLLLRGRRREAVVTVYAVLLSACLCYLAFVLIPVQGPRYFGPPEGVPEGPVRALVLAILEGGSSRGAAFPSAHMALMMAQAIMALCFQRTVGLVLLALTLGVGFGAVYGGFHYAVDMFAGALVGGAAAWVALRVHQVAQPSPEPSVTRS